MTCPLLAAALTLTALACAPNNLGAEETSAAVTASRAATSPTESPRPEPNLTARPTRASRTTRPTVSRPAVSPRPATGKAATQTPSSSRRADLRGRAADVTAYCTSGTMASGQQTRVGAIATLDRSIPFGTRVLINGRTYTVLDRIGHGSQWDIYMPSCRDAIQWGRRRLEVVVLR